MATNEEKELLASMAGTTVAFFRSNSELSKLFDKALKEGWTADRLLAASKNTDWYKRYSSAQREAQVLKKSDPAEYKRRVAEKNSQVLQIARQMGISTKSQNLKKSLGTIGTMAFTNGWSAFEIQRYLGSMAKVNQKVRGGELLGGELGRQYAELRKVAYDNGVQISSSQWGKWIQALAQGGMTAQGIAGTIQKRAMSAFPGLRDEIKGGMSVREFADQYIQTMGKLLEINPESIDLFNKDIKAALNAKDKKGKFSPMTVTDFETRMRKDKRWLKTENARESLMTAGHEVLNAFGVTW